VCAMCGVTSALAADGNRLTYLDGDDPYYVARDFPKLTTPQWLGDADVRAVIVLAIDDMRDPAPYEAMLRPTLDRLKQIDGRAPVSIMTNSIDPRDPHLQTWLKEGVSLETHTVDHPCPLLSRGDFARALSTYERCVDLLAQVPNSTPVAFRMPCCDSMNTPGPRFFSAMFNRTTSAGHSLQIDSSVCNVTTTNDSELPREIVLDPDGKGRFAKYVPSPSFVNTVNDYPYPYLINQLCWELSCATPSDWSAFHLHGSGNPKTVEDWKALVDATVFKQGMFSLVFHPHGWIGSAQVADLVDYAAKKHGKAVKFLNFREALDALNRNLLAGQSVRAANGGDNGVRLLDLNADGYQDVVIGNDQVRITRVWSPKEKRWAESDFPTPLVGVDAAGKRLSTGGRFGIVLRGPGTPAPRVCLIQRNEVTSGAWYFADGAWHTDATLLRGLPDDTFTSHGGANRGVRLRDLDGDGACELIISNDRQQAVYRLTIDGWQKCAFALPDGVAIVDAAGRDAGKTATTTYCFRIPRVMHFTCSRMPKRDGLKRSSPPSGTWVSPRPPRFRRSSMRMG
jgi:hypothetical protein